MSVITQGDIISGAVGHAMSEVKAEIASINKILQASSNETFDRVDGDGISLFRRGKMVWWTKKQEASSYRLRLFVGNDEIDIIEIDRSRAYHTFTDLVGMGMYKVSLEVEDRDGNIINMVKIDL